MATPLLFAGLGYAQSALPAGQAVAAATVSYFQEATADVPAGGPLTEGEIIILLQAKVPLETVQTFVSKRGVSFVSNKETSRKILAAGGNVALIGTISLNQRDDMAPPVDPKKKK